MWRVFISETKNEKNIKTKLKILKIIYIREFSISDNSCASCLLKLGRESDPCVSLGSRTQHVIAYWEGLSNCDQSKHI